MSPLCVTLATGRGQCHCMCDIGNKARSKLSPLCVTLASKLSSLRVTLAATPSPLCVTLATGRGQCHRMSDIGNRARSKLSPLCVTLETGRGQSCHRCVRHSQQGDVKIVTVMWDIGNSMWYTDNRARSKLSPLCVTLATVCGILATGRGQSCHRYV